MYFFKFGINPNLQLMYDLALNISFTSIKIVKIINLTFLKRYVMTVTHSIMQHFYISLTNLLR